MKTFFARLLTLFLLSGALNAYAVSEREFNTPGINVVKARMQARHGQLQAYYNSGAVGLNLDGTIELRDEASVPLVFRRKLAALVDAENQDRETLYGEISNAYAHPEWLVEVREVFAKRWLKHAHRGWWIMSDRGWIQK